MQQQRSREELENRLAALERENLRLRALIDSTRRSNRPRLADVLDSVFAFVGVLSTDGILLQANRSAREAAGLQPQDVVGKHFADTYWWAYSAAVQQELRAAIARARAGESSRYDVLVRLDESKFITVDFALVPMCDSHGRIAYLIPSGVDVTDRERARSELQASEQLLLATFEHAAVGLAHVNSEGRFVRVNRRLCEITGYSEEEMTSRTFHSITHPDDLQADELQVRRLLAGRDDTYRMEKRYIRKDSSVVWVQVTVSLLRDLPGRLRLFFGVIEDISERKAAEEELAESRRRLNMALRAAQMGTWDIDLPSGKVTWSESTELIFGAGPGTVRSIRDVLSRVHPHDRRKLRDAIWKAVEDGAEHYVEYRMLNGGKPSRWIASRGEVIRNCDGQPLRLSGALMDVTDQRVTEQRLKAFADSNVVGILFGDIRGSIFDCNDEMLRIVGYSRDDVNRGVLRWTDLTPPEYLPLDEQRIAEATLTGAGVPYEKEYIRKDRSRVPVLVGFTLLREDRSLSVAFILDISERKAAEAALEKQARALARSNADLRQFAYITSHDLQEPLRMVVSYTQLLAKRYQDRLDQEADRFIGFAVDGALRMERLLRGVLDYSQAGEDTSKPPKLFYPAEAVRIAISNLCGAIEESCARICVGELPPVLAAEVAVTQIFQNLIGNAIKYRAEDRSPFIEVSAEAAADFVVFTVSDNGIGIDAKHYERIFRIFKRLHPDRSPGTGIGLAICAKLVDRYGGRIWVDSEPGVGSRFRFTLPTASAR